MDYLVATGGLLALGLVCLGCLMVCLGIIVRGIIRASARWIRDFKRPRTPEELRAKKRAREKRNAAHFRINRKIGLLVLGLVTPWALLFALDTLYRGNTPWEWLWSLSFATLWLLARPSYAAASGTFFWIMFFFSCRYFAVNSPHLRNHPLWDEDIFYMLWSQGITLTALVLGTVIGIAGTIHTWLALRRNPAPVI